VLALAIGSCLLTTCASHGPKAVDLSGTVHADLVYQYAIRPDGEAVASIVDGGGSRSIAVLGRRHHRTTLTRSGRSDTAVGFMPSGDLLVASGSDDPSARSALVRYDDAGRRTGTITLDDDLHVSGIAVVDEQHAILEATPAGDEEAETSLWTVSLDDSATAEIDLSETGAWQQSPVVVDERTIVFSTGVGESFTSPGADYWLASFDLRTHRVLRLTSRDQLAYAPSRVPGRPYVVYEALRSDQSHRSVWWAEVGAHHSVGQLTSNVRRSPEVTPRGDDLAYLTSAEPGEPVDLATERLSGAPW
jgi:hypothetical protein